MNVFSMLKLHLPGTYELVLTMPLVGVIGMASEEWSAAVTEALSG